jgi:phenylacetate-CoA ligase
LMQANYCSLCNELEETQWLPGQTIYGWQRRRLVEIIDHAVRTVPHYADSASFATIAGGFTLSENSTWTALPILTRETVRRAGPSLRSNAVPPAHGDVWSCLSSGSTGRPIEVLATSTTQLFWDVFTLRDHFWHGRDFGRKLAVIRSVPGEENRPPHGSISPNWGSATAGMNTGPCVTLDVNSTIDEQAQWLLKYDPEYLLTYPSIVVALAKHFRANGLHLANLRQVRTFGEILESSVRDVCRTTWNVDLVDNYSATEVGYIALQCPIHPHYHVQSESLFVEVINERGDPCEPGEVGNILVTTLTNWAMPLIRYEIGDYAEVGPPCPCGRGLPVLTRIIGRQRNMLVLPDGRRRWPALELSGTPLALADLPPVEQFQLVQRSLEKLDLYVIVPRALSEEEESVARMFVLQAVGHPFEVDIHYVERIARGPTGKFEDFRCELDAVS